MKHILRYFSLLTFFAYAGCGLQVQSDDTTQNIDPSVPTLKLNVSGLDSGETVYLLQNLNIEGYDENRSYALVLTNDTFNLQDFAIVQQPCFKACELNVSSNGNVAALPELNLQCYPKIWDSVSQASSSYISFANSPSFRPVLDLSDNNEAMLLWREGHASNANVFAGKRESNHWTFPQNNQNFINATNHPSRYPDVASNDQGLSLGVWQGLKNDMYVTYAAFYTHDQGWANVNDNNILSPMDASVYYPKVDLNNVNDALVVWTQINGNGVNQIFFAEYINGQWHKPSSSNDLNYSLSPSETTATDVQVKLSDDGNALVSWRQINQLGEWQVFFAEKINGVWLKPLNTGDHVSPAGTSVTGAPAIDMNDAGDVVLAWSQINLTQSSDRMYVATRKNGFWQFPLNMNQFVPASSGVIGSAPSVSINNLGEAYLTWAQQRNAEYKVYVAFQNMAGLWQYPDSQDDYVDDIAGGQSSFSPKVKVNDQGRALLLWSTYQGNASNIYADTVYLGQWAHAPQQLSFSQNSSAEELMMDFNESCQALAAWTHKDDQQNRQVFVAEIR